MLAADFVTPTDSELIPTGEITAVAGTARDFTTRRPIHPNGGGARTLFDINYVLRRTEGAFCHAATLASRASGTAMELWTSEPGVQFYDGHLIDLAVPGLGGVSYGRHAGLCLEPQRFPDGPNKAHFPPCILEPGQVSRQVSEMRFSFGEPA
jgi:aldose 1-epimerase